MANQDALASVPLAGFRTAEEVLAGLRQRGGRVTHARRLLLGALFRDRNHRSAEDLADEVRTQASGVNISTIYRNLDELVRLGLVSRTYIGGGPATYQLASTAHGHLVCRRCGSVTETSAEFFGELADTLAATYGFAVDPDRFAVIGLCTSCQ